MPGDTVKEAAGKPGTEGVDQIGEASSASHWKFFLTISFQEQCSYFIIFTIKMLKVTGSLTQKWQGRTRLKFAEIKFGKEEVTRLHINSGQPGIYPAPHLLYLVTRTSGQKTLVVLFFMIAWSMIDKEYGKKEYL